MLLVVKSGLLGVISVTGCSEWVVRGDKCYWLLGVGC